MLDKIECHLSAGGLLDSLKRTFGVGQKKSSEAPAGVGTPSSPEMPVASSVVPALEPAPTPMPEAPEMWILPEAPMPAPEAQSALPAVEVPVAPSAELPAPTGTAVEAEKSPEQLAIEQFEEALLSADDALAKLMVGESLNETQLRAAKAAAATTNGLIRDLPEHYLRVLLASRRLGENRNYNRLDFQKDMIAAIRVFSQANKG